jgi:hypothetical protein
MHFLNINRCSYLLDYSLSTERGREVGLDTGLQHALEQEINGGNVGAVRLIIFSTESALSEQASKPALAINDSRARVARPGEATRLGVARPPSTSH